MENPLKKLTGFGLCLAASTSIFAQQQKVTGEHKLSPRFGVKRGINLSNLYVDNVQNKNVKVGANVGFYAKLPIVKGLSIQSEILYSQKGAQLNYNNIFGSGKYCYNFNHI